MTHAGASTSSSARGAPERDVAQVVAIQIEQVEEKQHHRRGARQVGDGGGIGVGDARLDEFEAADALAGRARRFRHRGWPGARRQSAAARQLGILALAAAAAAGEDAERSSLRAYPENRGRARHPT